METNDISQTVEPVKNNSGLSFRGLTEIFYQPSIFFKDLKDNPKILVPYIALTIVMSLFFYLAVDYIVMEQMKMPQIQDSIESSGMSEATMRTFMYWQTLIGGVLSMLILPLISSGLALFFGNFVFGGITTYKKILSVTLYGGILYGVGSLLHVPLIMIKKSVMVTFSPAVLVADQGMQSFWYTALSKISVFHIWEVIVVGIGLSIIYGISRNKGYLLSVLSVGMMAIIHVIITGIALMFK